MKSGLLLLGLLAVWMALCWPHLQEQWGTTGRTWETLGSLSRVERAAAVDEPGYRAAQAIARGVPAAGCVVVAAHTGPERLKYYQSRFAYYLYPRRVRLVDRSGAAEPGCPYLAVFRDLAPGLAQDPFRGHWDERQLGDRTASMTRVLAADRVEVYR